MSAATTIEWTDSTWNPFRARDPITGAKGWHCEKISPACDHCYAARMNKRTNGLTGIGTGHNYAPDSRAKVEVYIDEKTLLLPLKWRKPRKIFVCSMTDVFGEWHTDEMIDRVFAVMALCPQHTFQVLTKRPERMNRWFTSVPPLSFSYRSGFVQFKANQIAALVAFIRWPLPNVWLGVTAENQEQADARIPLLLQTPAAKRFVSIEPMLGPVDVGAGRWVSLRRGVRGDWPIGHMHHVPAGVYRADSNRFGALSINGLGIKPDEFERLPVLDWIIAGGESGPKARPSHPDWFRSLRNQCVAAGVAFFFKQWGGWVSVSEVAGAGAHFRFDDGATVRRTGKKTAGRLLDGVEWSQFPEELLHG